MKSRISDPVGSSMWLKLFHEGTTSFESFWNHVQSLASKRDSDYLLQLSAGIGPEFVSSMLDVELWDWAFKSNDPHRIEMANQVLQSRYGFVFSLS